MFLHSHVQDPSVADNSSLILGFYTPVLFKDWVFGNICLKSTCLPISDKSCHIICHGLAILCHRLIFIFILEHNLLHKCCICQNSKYIYKVSSHTSCLCNVATPNCVYQSYTRLFILADMPVIYIHVMP